MPDGISDGPAGRALRESMKFDRKRVRIGPGAPDLLARTIPSRKHPMKNPWMKKNPFMSMWLSGANAVVGSARGRVAAESKRQTKAVADEATRQVLGFWSGVMAPTPAVRKRKKPR